jgi:hypothetical protein
MPLTDAEVARVKAELGYNLLTIGALPYIGHAQIFDNVIQPYLDGGAATTSSTAVTAATSPTPVALTLAAATGFAAGVRVVVDVDTRQEVVTAQSLAGSILTVQLSLAHSGTYPVIVEGGESIVRDILRKIDGVRTQLNNAASTAGIKQVDVIEFHGSTSATSQYTTLKGALAFWRGELASVLGIPDLHALRSSAGQVLSLY